MWSLSKNKLRPQLQIKPAPQPPQPRGFWETRALPFLDKRALPLALFLIATGIAVEYLAWAGGFGAVLANTFTRWRARRTARTTAVAPPPA